MTTARTRQQSTCCTPAQAWAILNRHAREEITPLRLQELCRDNDRVSSLVAVYNTNSPVDGATTSATGATTNSNNNKTGETMIAGEQHMLIADLSRQRMTLDTVNHLLRFGASKRLRQHIIQTAWGQNNPHHPVVVPDRVQPGRTPPPPQQQQQRPTASFSSTASASVKKSRVTEPQYSHGNQHQQQQKDSHEISFDAYKETNSPPPDTATTSMHMSLRVPKNQGYEMFTAAGHTVLPDIHQGWDRLERLSYAIRRGNYVGVSGSVLKDVVVIGRGVAVTAVQFVYDALLRDEKAVLYSRMGLKQTNTMGGADNLASIAAARIRRNLTGMTSASSSSNNTSHGGGSGVDTSSSFSMGTVAAARRLHFITRVDPLAAAQVINELDPASTIVVSIALNGNEETGLATRTFKSWLLQSLGRYGKPDLILAKHMMLVTGNDHIATVINKPESVHVVPQHSRCEAFSTFTASSLLPLSIVFGWPIVKDFLAGAHDMDNHFVDTNPRHNLPVLLALADIWNDILLGSSTRIMTPFTDSFAGYPAFCAALESQACSKPLSSVSATTGTGQSSSVDQYHSHNFEPGCGSSFVVDGGVHGVYDRSMYQSSKPLYSEVLVVMDSQVQFNTSKSLGSNNGMQHIYATQDNMMISAFAHCDELAFGSERLSSTSAAVEHGMGLSSSFSVGTTNQSVRLENEISEGNRPSCMIICGKLGAFTCGQLIALAEHRAIVKAHLWGRDPYVSEVGSALRMHRADFLKDELQALFTKRHADDEDNVVDAEQQSIGRVTHHGSHLTLSTKTILEHYATMSQDARQFSP